MKSFTDLRFVPLGGVGEIGVNRYLYGQDGRWLMVDLGIGFADDRLPGSTSSCPTCASSSSSALFSTG